MDKRYGRIPRIWCAMVWALSAVMLMVGITLFYTDGLWLSAVLIGGGAAAFAVASMLSVMRKSTMEKFLEIVAGHDGEITSNILSVFPSRFLSQISTVQFAGIMHTLRHFSGEKVLWVRRWRM